MIFKAYAPLKITYYCKAPNQLGFKGIKFVKKFDMVKLPKGTVIENIEFYPKRDTYSPPMERNIQIPNEPIDTFWFHWQVSQHRQESLENICGNLADLDINPKLKKNTFS